MQQSASYGGLDREIDAARASHLRLRGHLRDAEEFAALDGAYNALKSPLRLTAFDDAAPVDLRCESLEYMVTSLHRVDDLLTTLANHTRRRTHVGSTRVESALAELRQSSAFQYFDHFTDHTKHSAYVPRGVDAAGVYFDEFTYTNRQGAFPESRKTAAEIVDLAGEYILLAAIVIDMLADMLYEVSSFVEAHSQVCATPVYDPSLYRAPQKDKDDDPSA